MSRGRPPLILDKREFQEVINKIESENVFPTRAALWEAVAKTEWAVNLQPRPLTAQVAMIRADELGLNIKTVKGQRGRTKGEKPVSAGRGRRKRRMTEEQSKILRRSFPKEEREALEKTFQRAENGSIIALIKLKCLDCCGGQKKEVALCPSTDCALWTVRPYKRDNTVSLEVIPDPSEAV